MSMIAYFLAVDSSTLEGLPKDDFAWAEAAYSLEPFDMDKAWHGIHYLLTGQPGPGPAPLEQAIMGGVETGPDLGYGPPRLLSTELVASIASALSKLTFDDVRSRYDPQRMIELHIYPTDWDQEEEPWIEDLEVSFPRLVEFYENAAAQGKSVLLWIG